MFTRSASLLPLAGVMLAAVPQVLAQCQSYGIDIVNGGAYFINTNSNDSFSSVSQFSGCNNDTASVIISGPDGIDSYCDDIPLQPDYTSELSLCPELTKNEMVTGDYELTLLSNNGDGDPFANQRDFYVSAGPQQTVTATPTLIYNFTTTPTVTATTTSVVTSVITIKNSKTTTVPSATLISTVYPSPTTITATTTLTRTLKAWARTSVIVTATITADCTVPPRPWQPDPTWHRRPAIVHTLPTGLSAPSKRDAAFAIRDALRAERRSLMARDELEGRALDKRNMAKRSVDVATTTVTETTSTATSTSTFYAATSTVPAIVVSTTTTTTTLPPKTIISGRATSTVTASQQTRTRLSVTTTYSWTTKTMTASFTHFSTVTPSASVTACKKQGGHFGSGGYGGGGGWW